MQNGCRFYKGTIKRFLPIPGIYVFKLSKVKDDPGTCNKYKKIQKKIIKFQKEHLNNIFKYVLNVLVYIKTSQRSVSVLSSRKTNYVELQFYLHSICICNHILIFYSESINNTVIDLKYINIQNT